MYTNASQMDSGLPCDSRCTETKAPGMGRAQGRNSGRPSSMYPVNLLQIAFTPKSGLLLPTRTVTVAGRFDLSVFVQREVTSCRAQKRDLLVLTATGGAEVDADQLNQIRFQQVDVPPGTAFRLRHRTCVAVEIRAGGAVDGALRRPLSHSRGLHRCLSDSHVQDCAACKQVEGGA